MGQGQGQGSAAQPSQPVQRATGPGHPWRPPAGPAPGPIRVQRRAKNTGVIAVAGQHVALARINAHQKVTVHVADTTLAIELPRLGCPRSATTDHHTAACSYQAQRPARVKP